MFPVSPVPSRGSMTGKEKQMAVKDEIRRLSGRETTTLLTYEAP